MTTVLLCPDSFKGSLSAPEAAEAMARGLRRVWPGAEIHLMPMADGGEGTLDAVLAATEGQRLQLAVSGADGRPVTAAYGVLDRGEGPVAVLEAAQVVGLTLPLPAEVAQRTTLGLGELVRHCLDQGIRDFMIGLGGSSTNDGGSGVLAALGARLLDHAGQPVHPSPSGLARLVRVDLSGLDRRLKACRITLMADVVNPLCGPLGATAVFGPQKGVAPGEAAEIDGRLRHLAALCDAWYGGPLSTAPGTGAAGGLGYGFALLGASIRSGAEVVCELMGMDAALRETDWVVTGEGRSDAQTLQGKVPMVVAARAARMGVPVTLVSGSLDRGSLPDFARHFQGCFSIAFGPDTLERTMAEGAGLLADSMEQLARLLESRGSGSFPRRITHREVYP